MEYRFDDIEKRWQEKWRREETYKVELDTEKQKYYVLDMFPYPSGAGLHVGHPLGYIATDILSRYKRMQGFNVLHPMGFDAFGLPAEQYAIETGQHPAVTTAQNIKRYKEQLSRIGFDYDWSREVQTCDPKYYKWTQWIFLRLFDYWYNKAAQRAQPIQDLIAIFTYEGSEPVNAATSYTGSFTADEWNAMDEVEKQKILLQYRLAYQAYADVNWCPALGTVLANDEVKDGRSERGGHPVYRKRMRQWFLRITAYADRLLEGLERIQWPESLKEMQRNWIGRSEGATVFFPVKDHDKQLEIFTTRPDTIFGATFMVLAPEHPWVQELTTPDQKEAVEKYVQEAAGRSDVERMQEKKVTGVFTGSYAGHPFKKEPIPIWVAEYVLIGYGSGAIMAVPSDDERDNAFAKKFGLPIIEVIDRSDYPDAEMEDKVGKLINSGFLNGMEVQDAIETIIGKLEEAGLGHRKVNYKMRDAGFSRQRYWGEPFPIVYRDDMPQPLPDERLPLELPEIESYKPTEEGEAPLARNKEWVNSPRGQRETDTMPGYAGSSWYFLRFMDPHNDEAFASKVALEYWDSVDFYMGGAEHAVGHLLYARFWHKFLYDLHYTVSDEPFKRLVNQGMIQGQSAIIYKVRFGSMTVKRANQPPVNKSFEISPIYISGELVDKQGITLNKEFEASTKRTLNKYILAAEDQILKNNPDMDRQDVGIIWNLISPLRIDVNLVDHGIVDIEGLKKWRSEDFEDAIFIKSGSDFLAGSEVEKMSKRWHNVVNPDDVINQYGADTFRMYEMFLGPIDVHKPWDTSGIEGVSKFIKKFWRLFYKEDQWLVTEEEPNEQELKALHTAIRKVNEDIGRLAFNTAVSAFMVCANELTALDCHKRAVLEPLVRLLAPFAPHVTEELWHKLGHEASVHHAEYPVHEEKYLVESTVEYPISVNGKVRTKLSFPADAPKEEIEKVVLADETVRKWLEGQAPKRVIVVPGRIVNVVK